MDDQRAIDAVYHKYTKASIERLHAMVSACRYIDNHSIEGDIVECGVWRGGHIILARMISPSRRCWLYDTFSGMTEPDERDVKMNGVPAGEGYWAKKKNGMPMAYAGLEEVRTNLRHTGTLDENLTRFVVGDVCKTLSHEINLPKKIALLRLDTDWYRSTKYELKILYPRLSKSGILIVDDYGHWRGSRDATQEYMSKACPDYHRLLKPIDDTAVIMVKP